MPQRLIAALELMTETPRMFVLGLLVIFQASCASVSTDRPEGEGYASVRIQEINGEPQVLVYRVRSWFTLSYPWEKGVGNPLPRILFLSGGRYTIEALCEGGPIYVDASAEYVISARKGRRYFLSCNPSDGNENFAFSEEK